MSVEYIKDVIHKGFSQIPFGMRRTHNVKVNYADGGRYVVYFELAYLYTPDIDAIAKKVDELGFKLYQWEVNGTVECQVRLIVWIDTKEAE